MPVQPSSVLEICKEVVGQIPLAWPMMQNLLFATLERVNDDIFSTKITEATFPSRSGSLAF